MKGVNDFFKKNYSGTDVREGMAGAIAVKIKEPVFESQTKNKLGNSDIRGWIVNETKAGIVDFLHKNKEAARAMENKIMTNGKAPERAQCGQERGQGGSQENLP